MSEDDLRSYNEIYGKMKYYDNCRGLAYTIKSGDTLYGISKKYNVPLALILRANPYVDIYNLQVGEKLR